MMFHADITSYAVCLSVQVLSCCHISWWWS